MHMNDQDNQNGCGGECSNCSPGSATPATGSSPGPASGGFKGWPLVISAAAAFLLPLVLAMTGAVIGRDNANNQVALTFAGLAIGLVIALVIHKVLKRKITSPRDDEEIS